MIKAKEIVELFKNSKENKYQKFLREESQLIKKIEELIKERAENVQRDYAPSECDFTKEEWDKVQYTYDEEIIRYFTKQGFNIYRGSYWYSINW